VIRWDDAATEVLLNPRLPAADAARVRDLIAAVPPLAAHVWLTTSGSTGRLKPVALAKRALLRSAAAVNGHLASDAHDVWLNVLPPFHVGGLGIHARAHLSGASVEVLDPWDPAAFGRRAAALGATLSALVPTQVSDLVRGGLRAPPTVRAVIVGGGALAAPLYERGRALGWPLLPSYGATECASQAATAELASLDRGAVPALRILPHVTMRTEADGTLALKSDALFTGYATAAGLDDPKRDGWWRTDDLGAVRADGTVDVRGRAGEVVKIGGELVTVTALQQVLDALALETAFAGDAALVPVADERLGAVLVLVAAADPAAAERLRAAFNARVLPFERARALRIVAEIPRTALGKIVLDTLVKSEK